jgi:transcriptional regulator with XRE-family HTH domain
MTLGERLLILRRWVGLSQEGPATASGLNRNTIAQLEQNDLQDLSGQSIVKVARALGCTTDVLLGVGELAPETADTGEPLPPQPARRGRHRRAAAEV